MSESTTTTTSHNGEGGGGDTQSSSLNNDETTLPTNEMAIDNVGEYEYTPKNIGQNNIIALQGELDRMKNFMRTHKKGLEDMDDGFISDFQALKKNLATANESLNSYFTGLKDYGCDDSVIKTMRQICSSTDPLKQESKNQFVTYANANMTQKLESESKINKMAAEKRKLDEENDKLKKELESVKKLKLTQGRDANYSSTTSTTTSSLSTNSNYNGRSPEVGVHYNNRVLNEKFGSEGRIAEVANVREVYLNSNAQDFFDMVRDNKKNLVKSL
jgi:hypothetical protein